MLEITKKRQKELSRFDIMQFLKLGVNKGDFSLKGFNNLDILFSHIPKWFDTELAGFGLKYEIMSELQNEVTLRIMNA
jgi:hypothetical protein